MTQTANNLVTLQDSVPTTTSLIVAEAFDKPHYDVLKSIRTRIDDMGACISKFTEGKSPSSNEGTTDGLNHLKTEAVAETNTSDYFVESSYVDSTGRTLPMYIVTEEGFALLAMGFTGQKALEFQIRFLNEFKRLQKDNQRLQLENTRLLEQRIERQKEDYRLLKGELGGDTVEYYTNKLSDAEYQLGVVTAERDNFLNKLAATKPPTKDERREVAMKAADKALKTRNAGIVKAVKKILNETKTIRARLRVFECAGDFVLANGLDEVEGMVRDLAYMTDEDLAE